MTIRRASDQEPFAALAFKIMNDAYVGPLTYLRVYSGRVENGSTVYNATKGKRERIGRLLQMHANKKEDVRSVSSGNIAAAVGLRVATTGDTLCDPARPVVLDVIEFPPPAMSVVIEPKTQAGEQELMGALDKLAAEDPSFRVSTDPETGQTLLSGMGELHLEIIVDRLVREFKVGGPRGPTPGGLPGDDHPDGPARGDLRAGGAGPGPVRSRRPAARAGRAGPRASCSKTRWQRAALPKEFVAAVERGARASLGRGPLAGYPMIDTKVTLLAATVHPVDSNEAGFPDRGFSGGRRGAPRRATR